MGYAVTKLRRRYGPDRLEWEGTRDIHAFWFGLIIGMVIAGAWPAWALLAVPFVLLRWDRPL